MWQKKISRKESAFDTGKSLLHSKTSLSSFVGPEKKILSPSLSYIRFRRLYWREDSDLCFELDLCKSPKDLNGYQWRNWKCRWGIPFAEWSKVQASGCSWSSRSRNVFFGSRIFFYFCQCSIFLEVSFLSLSLARSLAISLYMHLVFCFSVVAYGILPACCCWI